MKNLNNNLEDHEMDKPHQKRHLGFSRYCDT
jgi:hypothetical protein